MGTIAQMKIRRAVIILFAAILLAAFAFFAVLDRFSGPRFPTSAKNSLLHTLRQIDTAKQQFAAEHGGTADTVPSREQLLQYFPQEFWWKGAEYRIKSMREQPEAQLVRPCDELPPGTVMRLSTNKIGYEIVLPNK